MAEGKVLYALQDDVYVLKFIGDIRFNICTAVDQFIQHIFGEEKKIPVLIDMLETDAVDSTALGVLAQVAIKMREHFNHKPTILVASHDLNTILQSVCFDQVFTILHREKSDQSYQFTELEQIDSSEKEFAEHVLKAHQHLMSISPKNEAMFMDVAALIKSR